jgi:Nuclease-related domain
MRYTKKVWIKVGAFFIGLAVICSAILVLGAWDIKNKPKDQQTLILYTLFFIFLGYFLSWLSRKIETRWLDPFADKLIEEARRAELGDEGEDGVCDELARILGNEYSIHRNFNIPGRKFDIDAIIVSGKGIIVFEIKNPVNRMVFDKNTAYFEKDGELWPLSYRKDPRYKLNGYCYTLNNYLTAKGLGGLTLHKAVAFLKQDAAMIFGEKNGIVVVSGVQDLEKYISTLSNDPRFTPEFCARINTLLTRRS